VGRELRPKSASHCFASHSHAPLSALHTSSRGHPLTLRRLRPLVAPRHPQVVRLGIARGRGAVGDAADEVSPYEVETLILGCWHPTDTKPGRIMGEGPAAVLSTRAAAAAAASTGRRRLDGPRLPRRAGAASTGRGCLDGPAPPRRAAARATGVLRWSCCCAATLPPHPTPPQPAHPPCS
jgi:hypothetical protein